MCGIIGYLGKKPPIKNLVHSFSILSARGYDSFGFISKKHVRQVKVNEESFSRVLKPSDLDEVFLGHTRWATHGQVSEKNAHPIKVGIFYVVMNGQLLNYDSMKKRKELNTDCDTEIVAYLYHKLCGDAQLSDKQLYSVTRKIVASLKGDFSFAVKYGHKIILYKRKNPLYIGIDDTNTQVQSQSFYFSSDYRIAESLTKHVQTVLALHDEDICILDKKKILQMPKHQQVTVQEKTKTVLGSIEKTSKYHTEMEIRRQGNFANMLSKQNIEFVQQVKKKLKNTIFLGEGSCYNVCVHLQNLMCNPQKTQAFSSSLIDRHFLSHYKAEPVLVYSQSGETKDIIDAVRILKQSGGRIYLVSNNPHSTLAFLSDVIFDLSAGIEIGVASTVAFTNALFVNYLLSQETIREDDFFSMNVEIKRALQKNSQVLQNIAKIIANNNAPGFVLSTNIHWFGLEASLKMSELTQNIFLPQNFNGLKHGFYACIDEEKTPIILDCGLSDNLLHQLKSRKAITIGFNNKKLDFNLIVPNSTTFRNEVIKIVFVQYLAFIIALEKNLNPDKPRNLAKSITVGS